MFDSSEMEILRWVQMSWNLAMGQEQLRKINFGEFIWTNQDAQSNYVFYV